MIEKRGYEVAAGAWPEFDAWLDAQPGYVQNLSTLDQLILYRDDSRPSWAQIDLLWAAIGIAWFAGLGSLVLWRGAANGVTLTVGCELKIRRWVKEGR